MNTSFSLSPLGVNAVGSTGNNAINNSLRNKAVIEQVRLSVKNGLYKILDDKNTI